MGKPGNPDFLRPVDDKGVGSLPHCDTRAIFMLLSWLNSVFRVISFAMNSGDSNSFAHLFTVILGSKDSTI